jgi:hypothetical protein
MTRPQTPLAVIFAAIVLAIALAASAAGGWRLGAASLVGALAGFALYHGAFGFTAGWRRFIRERRAAGLTAQLALVAMTTALLIPLIAWGRAIGVEAGGFVFPAGVAVMLGAFAFGFGMQLGGGCGSGTLFTVGGGSTRMLITLAFFILGGLVATLHWGFWQALPALPAIGLAATPLGPAGAVLVSLAGLLALGLAARAAERRRHGALEPGRPTGSLWRGPWSLAAGAVALTAVGALTPILIGRPWGVTSGLTLWGAQIAHALGVPIEAWPYWTHAMGQVEASIFASDVSVMNLGLIFGAAVAASLAGRFAPTLRLTRVDVGTAVLGGLLMGYGARIAFGCNIGALLGGIASGSLHGWVWFACAFAGGMLGVRARARLGMDKPLTPAADGPAAAARAVDATPG